MDLKCPFCDKNITPKARKTLISDVEIDKSVSEISSWKAPFSAKAKQVVIYMFYCPECKKIIGVDNVTI